MLYEKWLNLELLRNEPQCMLFFWSSDYSRRACAFHPGSNKSDFVSVEYACGWVGMEAEMERQTCSCVFWGAVSVCGPQMDLDCRLWDGPACSQMRFLSVGLPSPTAEKLFDLFLKGMFSVQKWSFINWIWGMISITIIFFFFVIADTVIYLQFYLKPLHDHGKPGNISELFLGTDYQNFKILLCRS